MNNRLLIVTGDGGESYEVLYALHRFQEANWVVDIAAPSIRALNLVRHDFMEGWDTYYEGPGYAVESTIALADVDAADYQAILLIGGRAPEYLRNDPVVLQLVNEFHTQDKWIYSICHGIQILATAGLCKDKQITCYEHCKFESESQGATWINKEAWIDGKIITGQTWLSHPDFYRLIFKHLPD